MMHQYLSYSIVLNEEIERFSGKVDSTNMDSIKEASMRTLKLMQYYDNIANGFGKKIGDPDFIFKQPTVNIERTISGFVSGPYIINFKKAYYDVLAVKATERFSLISDDLDSHQVVFKDDDLIQVKIERLRTYVNTKIQEFNEQRFQVLRIRYYIGQEQRFPEISMREIIKDFDEDPSPVRAHFESLAFYHRFNKKKASDNVIQFIYDQYQELSPTNLVKLLLALRKGQYINDEPKSVAKPEFIRDVIDFFGVKSTAKDNGYESLRRTLGRLTNDQYSRQYLSDIQSAK